MTRITPEALYALLPAVHRIRDAGEDEPLKALIAVLAREGAVLEESIKELLDNHFIETCAPWAVPYVGGTIGYAALHDVPGRAAGSRAEVANTIAYRRRKGTAAVLEALARDVTGWPARAVEYFLLVATCQHTNHIRPSHYGAPRLADPLPLEALGGAFDTVTRAVDVRSIQRSPARKGLRGKHNLPNVGIFLWRHLPLAHTFAPTTQLDARRYLFDALGVDPVGPPRQLVNAPVPEDEIATFAQPVNVPGDITRRMLHADPALWYGPGRSITLFLDGEAVPVTRIAACDLSDDNGAWNHSPHDAIDPQELGDLEGAPGPVEANALVRIDPELGRIAFPEEEEREVRATWHRAFPAEIGGGEYTRGATLFTPPGVTPTPFPGPFATLQAALDDIAEDGGIVEIASNDVIDAPAIIAAGAGVEVALRAADGFRPILRGAAPVECSGGEGARIVLDGFVLDGAPLAVTDTPEGDGLERLTLRNLTLVPGLSYDAAGAPLSPGAASLTIETAGLELTIDRSILGRIEMTDTTNARIETSIVDAAAAAPRDTATALAISGAGNVSAGALTISGSTVIGRVFARVFPLVTDSILYAAPEAPGAAPVRAERRQEGCMRFSFVPHGSVVPRRYRCQPQLAIDTALAAAREAKGADLTAAERDLVERRTVRGMIPGFVALGSSHPAFAQLRLSTPLDIREGAADGAEMGVYHHLHQPQRETNLSIRIEEYLRVGLEAGSFFQT